MFTAVLIEAAIVPLCGALSALNALSELGGFAARFVGCWWVKNSQILSVFQKGSEVGAEVMRFDQSRAGPRLNAQLRSQGLGDASYIKSIKNPSCLEIPLNRKTRVK